MNFLVDHINHEALTYGDVLDYVNGCSEASPIVMSNSPGLFFMHLIRNMCYNVDSLLFTEASINEGQKKSIPLKLKIQKSYGTADSLIEGVRNSSARISLFTSGTTGEPKEVRHTVRRFVDMTRTGDNYMTDNWALLYDKSHMAGLQVFFQAFMNFNCLHYLFQGDKKLFIDKTNEFKISNISATPTFYRLLAPWDFELNSVNRVTLGGEKADDELIKKLKKVFPKARLNNIYASTEAGSLLISEGSNFKILPEMRDKVKILSNEIHIHNSLLGDFDKPEWFPTGDIVEYNDSDGKFFTIVARDSDFVNIGGNRVNMLQVEEAILNVEGVVNAAVNSKKNSVLGIVLIAKVVLETNYEIDSVKMGLRKNLPEYMIPTKIVKVERLEKTESGKIKRKRE